MLSHLLNLKKIDDFPRWSQFESYSRLISVPLFSSVVFTFPLSQFESYSRLISVAMSTRFDSGILSTPGRK